MLYLVEDWRGMLGELSRVARTDGVILHEWGNGASDMAWVRYREALRARLAKDGLPGIFHPGARTQDEVESELAALGWTRTGEVASGPGTPMTLGGFIGMVERGEASYLWDVPDAIQARLIPEMRRWAQAELGDLDTLMELPDDAHWRIYRRGRG